MAGALTLARAVLLLNVRSELGFPRWAAMAGTPWLEFGQTLARNRELESMVRTATHGKSGEFWTVFGLYSAL
jgi:hypothetical protein